MDGLARMLVRHLLYSPNPRESSLADSEALLESVMVLRSDLRLIVEIGSKDASMIGAMHTKRAPLDYLLLHYGTDHVAAEKNISRFTTLEGFEEAMSQRSYPRALRGKQRRRVRNELRDRISTYARTATTDVQGGRARKAFPLPETTSGLIIRDSSLVERNRFGSIDDLLSAAKHKGYACVALMLPSGPISMPESDLVRTAPSGTIAGYRLHQRPPEPIGSVYDQLIDRAMGATSNRP